LREGMKKEEQWRETIGEVRDSGTQSLGEGLTRHQLTVGESRYGKGREHTGKSQGTSHALPRPERNGALGQGPHGSGLRLASYGKPWKINAYQ
jgi:hypothetical protein